MFPLVLEPQKKWMNENEESKGEVKYSCSGKKDLDDISFCK